MVRIHFFDTANQIEMLTKTKEVRTRLRTYSSGVGLVLLDAQRKAIYANAEAVRILAYPNRPRRKRALDDLLSEKMHLLLPDVETSPQPVPYRELASGRRCYLCHMFPASSRKEDFPDATVVVFKRSESRLGLHPSARSS